MKKKTKKIICCLLIMVLVLGIAYVAIQRYLHKKFEAELRILQYQDYCENLYIKRSDSTWDSKGVIVFNGKIDERTIDAAVAFRNLQHPEDPITTKEVLTDFYRFLDGEDVEGGALDKFDRSGDGTNLWGKYTEGNYIAGIQYYLHAEKGIPNISNATEKQVQEAIEAVSSDPSKYMGD